MNGISFTELELSAELQRAVTEMGFVTATDIQAQSIPLIQSGADVIGRSQTGTGKTVAFAIPALQKIDTRIPRPCAQVLILCPTRELAMQAQGEIKKLAEYMPGIRTADVYGGAPMDRQILKLKQANLVVGTPGRVMDHMRRGTLKLQNLRMLILDEADEMLSMGFREDIETILKQAPEERQTVLFSATMPPSIMALTRDYQKDPQLIAIANKQATVESIDQFYYDVPMGRKSDALSLLLHYHNPALTMIFCNTKVMVDDIVTRLQGNGFNALGLHGDMKQSQRTQVMEAFKHGKVDVLVATDVAARGIDVNGIDYVVNYDIPQNAEYYVHRIGRTGRAGKSGVAITLCSGRRQVEQLQMYGRMTKSKLTHNAMPKASELQERMQERNMEKITTAVAELQDFDYSILDKLVEQGLELKTITAALWKLQFGSTEIVETIAIAPPGGRAVGEAPGYGKIMLGVGRSSRVAPNHIVGAITERTGIAGKEIGKIEIYDDYSIVGIPTDMLDTVITALSSLKICGKPTTASIKERESAPQSRRASAHRADRKPVRADGKPFRNRHHDDVPKDYRRLNKKGPKSKPL